jgi:hypothetical protein
VGRVGLEPAIARIRRQKESAVDEQDFERATMLRDEERRLLSDRRAAEDKWLVTERVQEADLAREDAADGAADQPGDEAPGAASASSLRAGRGGAPRGFGCLGSGVGWPEAGNHGPFSNNLLNGTSAC